MHRSLALIAGPSLAALLLGSPCVSQTPPNIIVITLDDLGTDKLAFYGQPSPSFPPTPNLTALRQGGVLFTSAYVQPVCSPTRTCVQTGRYAFRTGMGSNPTGGYAMPDSEVTVAEMLKAGFPGQPQQYVCGVFGKYHQTNNDPQHPIRNGYDRFDGLLAGTGNYFSWQRVIATPGNTSRSTESRFCGSVTEQAALAWINAQNQPFFAWVCFNPPHSPYQVPPLALVSAATQAAITSRGYVSGQDLTNTADARLGYDWLIEAIDTEIGILLAGITPSKLQNTHVFILGDNGTPGPVIANPPYSGAHAKGSVFEQGVRVPMLVSGPLVTQPNSTCTGLVGHVDLFATIASITGAAGATPADSLNISNLITNPSGPSPRAQAFSQRYQPNGSYVPNPNAPPPGLTTHLRSLTDGRWKYIRTLVPPSSYTHEVYDLSADPLETNNRWSCYTTPGCLPRADRRAITALVSGMTQLSGL